MSNDDDDVTSEAIVWPLERLARLMRANEHAGGLNPAQWEALRYLARANRFSNSPGALTRYLGATKGTVSQTVIALERKGLVTKTVREGERRSVVLVLTAKGEAELARDPWLKIAEDSDELGGKTRKRLAKGLGELLQAELTRGGHNAFGQCGTCRFFREKGRDGAPGGPHLCMLLEQALTEPDSRRICIEHEAA